MKFETGAKFAHQLDAADPLASNRDRFYIPQHNGEDAVYLCGNSLGLQPKTVADSIQIELDDWKKHGVEGHVHGDRPWLYYHKQFSEMESKLVGAQPAEVVVMNTLTVNLHLLMVSFYRPTSDRFKIVVEGQLFPSDHYAVESQAKFHGFDPKEAIVELNPRAGEHTVRAADIEKTIKEHGSSIALVMLGGINYYSGQLFDMKTITTWGHAVGAVVGFDLAHAAGNVPMQLHDWGVDFACWCTYKYLNSGPGGPSGAFVHEKHHSNKDLPRFHGWWGYMEETRFKMKKGFVPMGGAPSWQLSNVPVLSCAAHLAALKIQDEVGMEALSLKSAKLTGYLEWLLTEANIDDLTIITPQDPSQRGAQLSLLTGDNGRAMFDRLTENGVIADWREPNVIRIAPVPMYNSFYDVYRFVELLKG